VVLAKVPPAALAHTTRSFTGLTAKNRWVVPLVCGVSVGVNAAAGVDCATALPPVRLPLEVGPSEQERVKAALAIAAVTSESMRNMKFSKGWVAIPSDLLLAEGTRKVTPAAPSIATSSDGTILRS
jgi:hypothetical protein